MGVRRQMGVRELARAEARMATGGKGSATAIEIVANIRAMELAIDEATTADVFGEAQLLAIHQRLMGQDPLPDPMTRHGRSSTSSLRTRSSRVR